MNATDRDALTRAVEIARKDPAEARRIDSRLARGDDWFDVARSAAMHCKIARLDLRPWQSAPMYGHIEQPRRDQRAYELQRRLIAAGCSIYEPDPLAALEQVGRNGLPGPP